MRYFLDTEFIENGKTIDLISIGIVSEAGKTLYLQNAECDFARASDWVWRNVFPELIHFNLAGRRLCERQSKVVESDWMKANNLKPPTTYTTKCGPECFWATRKEIKEAIVALCGDDKPEFWGYYADYDWVVFCQLFGTMLELPRAYPKYCRDLKQLLDSIGNPRIQKASDAHHALSDAEWIKETFLAITNDRTHH